MQKLIYPLVCFLLTVNAFSQERTDAMLFGDVKSAKTNEQILNVDNCNRYISMSIFPKRTEYNNMTHTAQREKIHVVEGDTVKENPFFVEASYIGDAFHNFSGGIKKGSTYLGMANIKIGFDTKKAGLWKGGELFLNTANTHGGKPSEKNIGDFQGVSNIETGNHTYMHELWYKQHYKKFTLIIGLQDLNSELNSSEFAGIFLNSSFGTHSTISDNVPTPIFPLTALGVQLQYYITDSISYKAVVFDGFPDDFNINPNNLNWRLKKEDGILSFIETTAKYSVIRKLSGTYKLGVYFHKHFLNSSEISDNSEKFHDNYGLYIVGDQVIYKNEQGKQLSLFLQSSISPNQKNENWYYTGFGTNLKGLFTKRIDDIAGMAIAHAGFYQNNLTSETTFELTYFIQITEFFFVQPDIQFILNPSANNVLKNAFVGFLRVGFDISELASCYKHTSAKIS